MTQSVIYRDLRDLGVLLEQGDLAPDPIDEAPAAAAPDPIPEAGPHDLAKLLAELADADAAIAGLARRDAEEREAALRDLAAYDALVAAQHEAEEALSRAAAVRRDAEALAEAAFGEEARAEAARWADQARQAEAAAGALAAERRAAAEQLAASRDLAAALDARRRADEAERARAAAAERARRLADVRAGVESALRSGRLGDARARLAPALDAYPDDPEVRALAAAIDQRGLAVKVGAAERALWFARRSYKRAPQAAVDRLAGLDPSGLPAPLARQLFGAWVRACERLCRARGLTAPLRYAPEPGRGVVLAAEEQGRYAVVSALGMGPAWRPGDPADPAVVRRARPL